MKTCTILSISSFFSAALPFLLAMIFLNAGNVTAEMVSLLSAFVMLPLASALLNASLDSEDGRKIYDNKKVGGIRFLRIGRLSFSFSVSQGKKVKQVNPSMENEPREIPYAGTENSLVLG